MLSFGYSLAYSVLGMAVVFAMLILLWAIMAITSAVLKIKKEPAVNSASDSPQSTASIPEEPKVPEIAAAPEVMQYPEPISQNAARYKVTLLNKTYEVEVDGDRISYDTRVSAPAPSFPAPAPAPRAAAAPAPAPVQAPVQAPKAVNPAVSSSSSKDVITSPLPGTIFSIKVNNGEKVKTGQLLLTIEAMKMENEILAPRDGTVSQVMVTAGATVSTGAPLLVLV